METVQIKLKGRGPLGEHSNAIEECGGEKTLLLTPHSLALIIRYTLARWPEVLPPGLRAKSAEIMRRVTFERVPDPHHERHHSTRADIAFPLHWSCRLIHLGSDVRVILPLDLFVRQILEYLRGHPNLDASSVSEHGSHEVFTRGEWPKAIEALEKSPEGSP